MVRRVTNSSLLISGSMAKQSGSASYVRSSHRAAEDSAPPPGTVSFARSGYINMCQVEVRRGAHHQPNMPAHLGDRRSLTRLLGVASEVSNGATSTVAYTTRSVTMVTAPPFRLRISANVTADFGNVTDSAGRRCDRCRFPLSVLVSSGSRTLGLGDVFPGDSPVRLDPVMTLHEAFEQRIGDGLVTDPSVPVLDQATGWSRCGFACVIDHRADRFEPSRPGSHSPIVQQENINAGDLQQPCR